MKLLVTGAGGKAGQFVVRETAKHHDVTGLDIRPDDAAGVPWMCADLMDQNEAREACKGFDAIIHLAAIPHPFVEPQEKILRVNVQTTYNVLDAAVVNGVRRVVFASSDAATGFILRRKDPTPEYLPVDEEHPLLPTETYSLSKALGEEICRMFHRTYGIEVAALRFSCIISPEQREGIARRIANAKAPEPQEPREFNPGTNDFYAYVLVEDVARACLLAAEADHIGFEAFFICADNTFCGAPTLDLARRYYDPLPRLKDKAYFEQNPRASFLDNRKARRLLGFTASAEA